VTYVNLIVGDADCHWVKLTATKKSTFTHNRVDTDWYNTMYIGGVEFSAPSPPKRNVRQLKAQVTAWNLKLIPGS